MAAEGAVIPLCAPAALTKTHQGADVNGITECYRRLIVCSYGFFENHVYTGRGVG